MTTSGMTSEGSRTERRRAKILAEIIETEVTYQRHLSHVIEVTIYRIHLVFFLVLSHLVSGRCIGRVASTRLGPASSPSYALLCHVLDFVDPSLPWPTPLPRPLYFQSRHSSNKSSSLYMAQPPQPPLSDTPMSVYNNTVVKNRFQKAMHSDMFICVICTLHTIFAIKLYVFLPVYIINFILHIATLFLCCCCIYTFGKYVAAHLFCKSECPISMQVLFCPQQRSVLP